MITASVDRARERPCQDRVRPPPGQRSDRETPPDVAPLDYLVYLAGPAGRRRRAGPDDRAVVCLRAAPGGGPVPGRRAAPQGRPGEPPAGVRRPLHRGRARSDRPGRLSAFLHDADGDPPHPAQAATRRPGASGSRWSGTSRSSTGCSRGGPIIMLTRPLRQLGDGRLPVRRLRLPAELGGPDARQPVPRPLPPARSASGPASG